MVSKTGHSGYGWRITRSGMDVACHPDPVPLVEELPPLFRLPLGNKKPTRLACVISMGKLDGHRMCLLQAPYYSIADCKNKSRGG